MKKVFAAITLLMLVQLIHAQDSSITKKNSTKTSAFLNPNIYKPEMAGDRDPFLWQVDGRIGPISYAYGGNGSHPTIPNIEVGNLEQPRYLGYDDENNSNAGVYIKDQRGQVYQLSGDFSSIKQVARTPDGLKNSAVKMENKDMDELAKATGEKPTKRSNITYSTHTTFDSSTATVVPFKIERTTSKDTFNINVPSGAYKGDYKAMPVKFYNNNNFNDRNAAIIVGTFLAITPGQSFNLPNEKYFKISASPDPNGDLHYDIRPYPADELKLIRRAMGLSNNY